MKKKERKLKNNKGRHDRVKWREETEAASANICSFFNQIYVHPLSKYKGVGVTATALDSLSAFEWGDGVKKVRMKWKGKKKKIQNLYLCVYHARHFVISV